MKKQLVLLGGGHAHLLTLANIRVFVEKGYSVTVVQPSEYHYYSGMGPGVLGGTYQAEAIRFATRKTVESSGGLFILDKAQRIDPYNTCVLLEESGKQIHYDVLSCNTGSFVPETITGTGDANVVFAKPIEALLAGKVLVQELPLNQKSVVAVIGSGPSAIEIAGNVHQLCKNRPLDLVSVKMFAGQSFMRGQPRRLRRLARKILDDKGIEIIEGSYVHQITQNSLIVENGQQHRVDVVFSAVGVTTSPIFSRSDLPTGPDGGLLVNEYLQSTLYDNVFGGGDCVFFESEPLAKVGVYAVRQNPVLYRNLLNKLAERPLEKFSPGGEYLRVFNMGNGDGLLSKWSLSFSGKCAFAVKDYIDRRFISRFS